MNGSRISHHPPTLFHNLYLYRQRKRKIDNLILMNKVYHNDDDKELFQHFLCSLSVFSSFSSSFLSIHVNVNLNRLFIGLQDFCSLSLHSFSLSLYYTFHSLLIILREYRKSSICALHKQCIDLIPSCLSLSDYPRFRDC